ncbi:MAG: hypothetical protein U5K33_04305 [Halofilum sp. (in: g-proteobacteria)]|nr:hypothetical protein [Halofilum sp. (in: g-proteobacteria)]
MQHHAIRNTRRTLGGSLLLAGALALAACGGGSSGSSGSLSLGITDAAVDSVEEVNVVFTGITLQPQDGDLNPCRRAGRSPSGLSD